MGSGVPGTVQWAWDGRAGRKEPGAGRREQFEFWRQGAGVRVKSEVAAICNRLLIRSGGAQIGSVRPAPRGECL